MLFIDQGFIIIKENMSESIHDESHDESEHGYKLMEDENQEMCKFTQNKKSTTIPCLTLERRMSKEGILEEVVPEKKHFHRHSQSAHESHGNDVAPDLEHFHYHGGNSQLLITTLGLVVHSLSDGFALGSATYSDINNSSNLHIIIFIALLLHKCPSAIGLATFLQHEGLNRKQIMKHLLVFTLTSPLASIMTFYSFSLFTD